MKFYSYSNNNHNYTLAVALENVRSVHLVTGSGKSAIRFAVRIDYANDTHETFLYLEEAEAKKVYQTIVDLLNKIGA